MKNKNRKKLAFRPALPYILPGGKEEAMEGIWEEKKKASKVFLPSPIVIPILPKQGPKRCPGGASGTIFLKVFFFSQNSIIQM